VSGRPPEPRRGRAAPGDDPVKGMLPKGMSPIERRLSKFLREPPTVKNAVNVVVTATTLVVIGAGVAMRVFDHRDFPNIWLGMWWAVQTVTTVGYGDITPTTIVGRVVAAVVMLEGVAFVAITSAAITTTFVARAQRDRRAAGTGEARARDEDARFDELTQRLERIESMLRGQGER
jgi:voltage-gated potassium channel